MRKAPPAFVQAGLFVYNEKKLLLKNLYLFYQNQLIFPGTLYIM